MEDHDEKAEELEKEVDDLQKRSDEVARQTDDTKSKWEARQADEGVPGAVDDDTIETATGAGDEEDEREAD